MDWWSGQGIDKFLSWLNTVYDLQDTKAITHTHNTHTQSISTHYTIVIQHVYGAYCLGTPSCSPLHNWPLTSWCLSSAACTSTNSYSYCIQYAIPDWSQNASELLSAHYLSLAYRLIISHNKLMKSINLLVSAVRIVKYLGICRKFSYSNLLVKSSCRHVAHLTILSSLTCEL